jgi:Flp pilus assembly protein TadG
MTLPNQKRSRGQALVEFALIVPVLITMLLFSMYFVEFVRAKLKVQEASRFIAFEMTSFTLSDYGGAGNNVAFTTARTEAVNDALAKYSDLESVDTRSPSNFFVSYSNIAATVNNLPVTNTGPNIQNNSQNQGGVIVSSIASVLNGTVNAMYNRFGFNTAGKVEVEVTGQISSLFLPQNFLNDGRGFYMVDQWGGTSLQNKPMRNRYTMVANGWHLNDGSDALMRIDRNNGGPRAGMHNGGSPHGIYLQVKKMQALGVANSMASIPGLSNVMGTLAFLGIPDPFTSAFAVAHNYGLIPNPTGGGVRNTTWGCNYYPSHPARDGLNNLDDQSGGASKLDSLRNKCYDTAPFRDQVAYNSSEYIQMFQARGAFFMGCILAEADDPSADTVANSVTVGDRNNRKIGCER